MNQAPSKNQLRQPLIGAGIEHKPVSPEFKDANSWFLHPYSSDDYPAPLKSAAIGLLTVIGALSNGWIVVSAISIALSATAPTASDVLVRSLIIGLVQGGYFWLIRSLTYDSSLYHYVYPENVFASFMVHEIGLIPCLAIMGLLYAGFAGAGGIMRVFGNAPVIGLVNGAGVKLAGSAKGVYWFVVTLLTFFYIFNTKYHNNDGIKELSAMKYQRTIGVYSVGVIVNVIFLSLINIVTLSSGLYVTAVIATTGVANHNVDWAFWVFVPLCGSTGAAAFLYYMLYWLGIADNKWTRTKGTTLAPSYDSKNSGDEPMDMKIGAPAYSSSDATRQRRSNLVTTL